MILVDMNQVMISNLMIHLNSNELNEDMVRHMILNSVRMYRTQFVKDYGEIVLAWDSKHYWRRDYFPHYKKNRRKARDKDGKDWESIFNCLNKTE